MSWAQRREHCKRQFSRDVVVDQIEQYYRDVLAAKVGWSEDGARRHLACSGNMSATDGKRLRVSVIIPAYRAAGTIRRAVDSVFAQTYHAAEIIVVDDGSPDDLAAAVAHYGTAVTLVRQVNQGAAAARNTGIDRASGDLIAFLDADDYWEPQKLARHVELYERMPGLGLTCSRYYVKEPGATLRQSTDVSIPLDEELRLAGGAAFQAAIYVWTGTVVVPRKMLREERFVSGYEPAEDRHLWVRLICRAPAYFLGERLATAVMEAGSLSRSSVNRDCSNMLRVVEANRDLLGWRQARKWQSHTYYRWAACEANPTRAVALLIHSWWLWPLPFSKQESGHSFARGRVACVGMIRLVRQWFGHSSAVSCHGGQTGKN